MKNLKPFAIGLISGAILFYKVVNHANEWIRFNERPHKY